MSLRKPIVCALALAAVSIAGAAQACPSSRVHISPPPGTTLSRGMPIVIDGLALESLEARGPVLWSNDDVVPLRVVASGGSHIELAIEHELADGTRYVLAVTRSAAGLALDRAEAPVRHGVWTGGTRLRCACHAGLSWIQGATLFGLLPFLASFGLTGLVLRRRRRRIIRSILL